MKGVILVIFLFLAQLSQAYDEEWDGDWFRFVNTDPYVISCLVLFHDGDQDRFYLRPGQPSVWYYSPDVATAECR